MSESAQRADQLRAICRAPECKHVWIVAHLPMRIELAAKLIGSAMCPRCGDEKPDWYTGPKPGDVAMGWPAQ